jgi:membrane associated rhomboid family serine protease
MSRAGYYIGKRLIARIVWELGFKMAYRRYPGSALGVVEYLIITNLILYIAVSINDNLIDLFGFLPSAFLDKPWTIVTNMFIHAPFPSIGHILGNMITLYFFGNFLVGLVRERAFLLVYFIGGIIGNLFMFLSPGSLAIGASGAIFAVGGTLAILRPRWTVYVFPIPVPIPLWVAVIGGFALTLGVYQVAWQAHLGGLASGLVMGYIFRLRERRRF